MNEKILSLLLALVTVCSFSTVAFAAPVDEATIDTTRTGSIDIFMYDLTNAEKDGVWDSSYVSTGVKDANGVEAVLGDPTRVSALNVNGTAYGYAVKGVEFTYVKVADIRTYTKAEDGEDHIELLYGIAPTEHNNAFLSAISVSTNDRYAPADDVVDGLTVYYYHSDTLIDGLRAALDANATTVKNALEQYARNNHGVTMTETDAYGHTSAGNLPLGLYLIIETRVPEMVTETTAPFLVSLPMTSVTGTNASDGGERWIYDVVMYPKNLTGICRMLPKRHKRQAMKAAPARQAPRPSVQAYPPPRAAAPAPAPARRSPRYAPPKKRRLFPQRRRGKHEAR